MTEPTTPPAWALDAALEIRASRLLRYKWGGDREIGQAEAAAIIARHAAPLLADLDSLQCGDCNWNLDNPTAPEGCPGCGRIRIARAALTHTKEEHD